MVRIDRPTPGPIAAANPAIRASEAVEALIAPLGETTVSAVRAHLLEAHRLDATDGWVARVLGQLGWQKRRGLLQQEFVWHPRRPDVIDLAEPPPRRSYDAEERALIAQGRDADAKDRWHERTGQ